MKCFSKTKNILVSENIKIAQTYFSRMKGLLRKTSLPQGEGLYITKCKQVHTFFMKFAIDVVFIDEKGKVLKIVYNMKPWRISPFIFSAFATYEFNAGFVKGKISEGDILEIK
ncbi:MAG: DUF192 domain-containing protein [Elusimicrobiaceae bacterium]|jgi:uncharacterized protein|nr:DUF192 domain-containing protein [Elusimicrobiaceae bacterium]MBT3954588.1 DUF192 domain-containing protein [Elusimicrobiaceae bacterium]MBT4007896.1 DUF192 domain-containing protein [Elusimicrobiaceae bacterium]MBT4402582.1 DUF192 domain-containing protein [Elusimicrobiaceae bacterium]MBT4439910.1 DUF192 domain-containing protein [Elusimicrobiaceae bacterium]